MKLSVCASFLLAASMMVPAAWADTEYFNTPAAGSVFYPGSKVVFTLDKLNNDEDKVTFAKLYRHDTVTTAQPQKKPTTSNGAGLLGKSPPTSGDDDNDDNDNDDNDNDNDDNDNDNDNDDNDNDNDDNDDDDDDNDDDDDDNDDDDDDNDDDNDDDDNAIASFVKTLDTFYGSKISDDNSDFSFTWTVGNLPAGEYHVQMEEQQIDKVTDSQVGDAGDQDDLKRSRTFSIVAKKNYQGSTAVNNSNNKDTSNNNNSNAGYNGGRSSGEQQPVTGGTTDNYTAQQSQPQLQNQHHSPDYVTEGGDQPLSETQTQQASTGTAQPLAVANRLLQRREQKKNMIRAIKQ